jgi:FlaG/FlaF family flagellin (archaellin)
MKRYFRRNKRGISTVIATIIIVAISITMAIAVAYWALGIGGSFTRFEKLQFNSAYAVDDSQVDISLKNTGTAAATIESVMINGRPLDGTFVNATITADNLLGGLLQPGDAVNATLSFTNEMQSGMSVEIAIQTAAGNSYPKTVQMP